MPTVTPPDELNDPSPGHLPASPSSASAAGAAAGEPRPAEADLLAVAGSGSAPSEIRAAWVDAWHEGLLSAAQITRLVNTLQAAHYNLIIAQVRKSGDAYYHSAYEPRASNIAGGPAFDPLADLIAKAHAAGLQVYAWLETYNIWSVQWKAPPADHVWSRHPEWTLKDRAGQTVSEGQHSLDPGIPGVQDYICRVALDVITQYDVDGINWDRIRYPEGYYWGYNAITATRFFDEYGYWPPEERSDPCWEAWAGYRRQQITDLLKKCYLEIAARKPRLAVSVDTVAWQDPDPNTYYTRQQPVRRSLSGRPGLVGAAPGRRPGPDELQEPGCARAGGQLPALVQLRRADRGRQRTLLPGRPGRLPELRCRNAGSDGLRAPERVSRRSDLQLCQHQPRRAPGG